MFGKIFGQIFDSSIACSPALRHFFMDMIVLADADGDVDMTPESIADRTKTPLAQVNEFIACLCAPDKRSRTPEKEGRRLELLDEHRDWGWHIINYQKFREIASNEQRKASQRLRYHRWKSKTSAETNAPLTATNAPNAMQKQKQKQKHRESTYTPECRIALFYLNEKSGRKFRETSENLGFIQSRLSEPDVSIDGVKLMIDRQCKLWGSTDMAEYLRPSTLFNKTKFDAYYAAKDQPINGAKPNPNDRSFGIKQSAADKGKEVAEVLRRRELAKQMAQTQPSPPQTF